MQETWKAKAGRMHGDPPASERNGLHHLMVPHSLPFVGPSLQNLANWPCS